MGGWELEVLNWCCDSHQEGVFEEDLAASWESVPYTTLYKHFQIPFQDKRTPSITPRLEMRKVRFPITALCAFLILRIPSLKLRAAKIMFAKAVRWTI